MNKTRNLRRPLNHSAATLEHLLKGPKRQEMTKKANRRASIYIDLTGHLEQAQKEEEEERNDANGREIMAAVENQPKPQLNSRRVATFYKVVNGKLKVDRKALKYNNVENRKHGKTHIVRRVVIKGGKGYKSVTTKNGRGKKYTVKRHLKEHEMHDIANGKFIGGLFNDCK